MKDIKEEQVNNKKIIDSIEGGIREKGFITKILVEKVLSGIYMIFNIPMYSFFNL